MISISQKQLLTNKYKLNFFMNKNRFKTYELREREIYLRNLCL